MRRVGVDDIRGVVAILPTPSLPGADLPAAADTVDLDETDRMTRLIVDAGVDVILTNGTFGEAATLTFEESLAFNDVVVRAVGGRIPVFAGATTLNTRDTLARARALAGVGADGLFVGRPMWLPLDDRQIVGFYHAIAEAIPDSALVIYDNAGVFKGAISSHAYGELAAIDQIVASKHYGVRAGDGSYEEINATVRDRLRLLPTVDSWLPTREVCGDVPAAWSGDVACGPEPALALRDALDAGDLDAARRVHADIAWATQTLFPDGEIGKFMSYSIQIDRAEFAAAGYITPGPARHPYTSAPASYLAGGAEVGRRFARLRDKYAAAPAKAPAFRP